MNEKEFLEKELKLVQLKIKRYKEILIDIKLIMECQCEQYKNINGYKRKEYNRIMKSTEIEFNSINYYIAESHRSINNLEKVLYSIDKKEDIK